MGVSAFFWTAHLSLLSALWQQVHLCHHSTLEPSPAVVWASLLAQASIDLSVSAVESVLDSSVDAPADSNFVWGSALDMGSAVGCTSVGCCTR